METSGQGSFDKLTIALEISEAIDKLSLSNFAIIGHDWGGTIGYLLATRAREKCFALVVEEEILPGVDVDVPAPGSDYYPTWHGPFNRAEGLAEKLVPGRESEYYGLFLRQSAGKFPLESFAIAKYLENYVGESQLTSTLGYYRSQTKDILDIRSEREWPLDMPMLALGGEFGMGKAVGLGLSEFGVNVTSKVIRNAGHYPAEQEPELFLEILLSFLESSRPDLKSR